MCVFHAVSYIWGSMGNHICQNCSDTAMTTKQVCIMPDTVPEMSDTDMIIYDTDMSSCMTQVDDSWLCSC